MVAPADTQSQPVDNVVTPEYSEAPSVDASPTYTYRDQSGGGGGSGGPSVAQGFNAFAAIATALTPLVALARPKQQSRPVVRRRPVQRITPAHFSAGGFSSSNILIVGGIGLAVLVLGIVALKK